MIGDDWGQPNDVYPLPDKVVRMVVSFGELEEELERFNKNPRLIKLETTITRGGWVLLTATLRSELV